MSEEKNTKTNISINSIVNKTGIVSEELANINKTQMQTDFSKNQTFDDIIKETILNKNYDNLSYKTVVNQGSNENGPLSVIMEKEIKKVEKHQTSIIDLSSKNRKAIILGTCQYDALSKLTCLQEDVKSLKISLEKLNFSVKDFMDLTLEDFKKNVNKFIEGLDVNDVALFYFSGHGFQNNGKNYLAPKDTNMENLKETSFPIEHYIDKVKGKNIMNIIFLDCCRTEIKIIEEITDIHLQSAGNMYIGYSTSSGDVSEGKKNSNSYFTEGLLKHINENLKIEDLMKRARIYCFMKSQTQLSWDSSCLMSDFYFNPELNLV